MNMTKQQLRQLRIGEHYKVGSRVFDRVHIGESVVHDNTPQQFKVVSTESFRGIAGSRYILVSVYDLTRESGIGAKFPKFLEAHHIVDLAPELNTGSFEDLQIFILQHGGRS